ncbi:hypothetical protein BASA83_012267 [Batrachochytrium salamandrivorans]|nr:hypothetical protein BASA83_012267 [Batrachochytrium salamandrivorans]
MGRIPSSSFIGTSDRTHAVTGFSPFFLLLVVFIPRLPTDETPPRNTLAPLDEIERNGGELRIHCSELGGSDMVKMKHHERLKLEFRWKGPYHVVDVGHPGTYWIMTPQGLRLPNAVNQNDLLSLLAPVVDNVDFFYDGTSRSSGSY